MKVNKTIENIMTRHSVRKYLDQDIPISKLDTILKAAMAAPTAKNKRPYHFVVIKETAVKEALSEVNPYSKMIKNAPVTIAVCGDILLESSMDFIHHDCAAAVQNILLAAHSLDLGAVWVGIRQDDERGWQSHVSNVLQLPDNIKPIALIPMGYPAENREVKDRFDDHLIHTNKW
ncbi:MAG TPA: nitroreductase family protein [Erysipelotrichaceae bacterium]|nr:nitroreductase family protein [Erysipelotrichaceae bacterium]